MTAVPVVAALLLWCEACGARVRVGRDDPSSFCAFYGMHLLPVVDAVETDDGDLIEVVTR